MALDEFSRLRAVIEQARYRLADLVRADNNRTGHGPGGRINGADTLPLQRLLGVFLTLREPFEGVSADAEVATAQEWLIRMTPEQVPAAMVEAAVRRRCEIAMIGDWDELPVEARILLEGDERRILAAALSVCPAEKLGIDWSKDNSSTNTAMYGTRWW